MPYAILVPVGHAAQEPTVCHDRSVSFPEQDDVSPRWLADALGHPGVDLEVGQQSIGTGQVGENVRYTLTWPAGVDAPATVVGKFPSPDPTSRETAAATGSYVKEVGFYRDLQRTVTIPTPFVYALHEDLAANRFLLLMEDISPAAQGDQIDGCSVAQAELAVDAIVGLHAPRWNDSSLEDVDWLTPRRPERGEELAALYGALYPGFVDRYRTRLGSDAVAAGERFGAVLSSWFTSFVTPQTLVHGDYRLDNMLFATGPGPAPLTVVDWQTTALGHGPSDLAYFVGAGLLPHDRRSAEGALVRRYASGLEAAGVVVDEETLRVDYALGTASGYLMAVVASMIVGRTDRGDEMFCVMAERHAEQMADWSLFDRIN
jgi:hypothetical protein